MANVKYYNSKLDRLNALFNVLLECCIDSVKDREEYMTYHDMRDKVEKMRHEERKKQGWSGVYEIVNGQVIDCLFEGDKESCDIYVSLLFEAQPKHKGNIIISPLN